MPVLDRYNPGPDVAPEAAAKAGAKAAPRTRPNAKAAPARKPAASAATWVTVRKGDTLYSVSFAAGHDFKAIAALNGIKPPYTIYPGQRIRLKAPPAAKRKPARAKAKPAPAKKAPAAPKRTSRVTWRWPTRGNIVRAYSAKAPRKKGIGIGGKPNQDINAAAAGKVVYSGDGVLGYGKLIIVKHNETYLSAYAHNNEVFVKEGQQVKRGEKIARMGTNENDAPMLHFEIRKNGKPVNPLGYLPRR